MSRRTVVWVPSAENELGEIWLAASDRNDVTSASQKIDEALQRNLQTTGVEVAEGLRGLEVSPLRVLFEVLQEDAMVRVLKVKRI